MGFRDTPKFVLGVAGTSTKTLNVQLGLLAATTLLFAACSSQEPAFTEDRSSRQTSAADATVGGQDSANSEDSQDSQDSIGNEADQTGAFADANDEADAGNDSAVGHDADGSDGVDGAGNSDSGSDGTAGNDGGSTGSDSGFTDSGSDGTAGTDSGDAGGTGSDDAGGTDSGSEDGITTEFVEMSVTQESPGKVDILWIVDTSGSMYEEQRYLGNNFNAMISQLAASGHDFQTAITTTDICDNTLPPALADRVCPVNYGGSSSTHLRGSFVGDAGRKVLKSTDPDLVSRFNTYVNRGVDGSGFEHGMKAAQLAVAKSLSGANEPLVRKDAFLAVIVVSDEEDDGIGLSKIDAYTGHNFYAEGLTEFRYSEDDMIAYLRGIKGEGKFSLSAITPTRTSSGALCSAPHTQPAEEGTQYIKAAQKSGGILQSICDTNWNSSLAEIGLDLSAQISQVTLEFAPNVATIKVYVDGERTSTWSYNAGNNAVKFDAGHVPATASEIEITSYKQ
jgi:hypothetical protein